MAVLETLLSVALISLLSFVGIFFIPFHTPRMRKIMLFLVSFAAGALLGDAFIHLLPEASEELGLGLPFSLSLISGILLFFILEKVIHWRHCHHEITKDHPHPLGVMNFVGDGLHNFIDGMVIAASYLASPAVGIATTAAVALHEIPQEVGDFGVLVHAGYKRSKALFMNFLTALTAFAGAGVVLALKQDFSAWLLPFTAGGFIYIAGSDLLPELRKDNASLPHALFQLLAIAVGVGVMVALLALE